MADYVNGSSAVRLDGEALGYEYPVVQTPQPNLTMASPRPKAASAPYVVTIAKCLAAAAVMVMVAAVVRMAVIALAYGLEVKNSHLNTTLEQVRSQGSELEVQLSVSANADHIRSLAVEVYGMVPAESSSVIDVSAALLACDPALFAQAQASGE